MLVVLFRRFLFSIDVHYYGDGYSYLAEEQSHEEIGAFLMI